MGSCGNKPIKYINFDDTKHEKRIYDLLNMEFDRYNAENKDEIRKYCCVTSPYEKNHQRSYLTHIKSLNRSPYADRKWIFPFGVVNTDRNNKPGKRVLIIYLSCNISVRMLMYDIDKSHEIWQILTIITDLIQDKIRHFSPVWNYHRNMDMWYLVRRKATLQFTGQSAPLPEGTYFVGGSI